MEWRLASQHFLKAIKRQKMFKCYIIRYFILDPFRVNKSADQIIE